MLFAGVVAAAGVLFAACGGGKIAYKNEVCEVGNEILNGEEPPCKDGQIFSFRPNRWGNEQLPVLVATYFCDFAAPIVQSKAGVACVYKRRHNAK